MILQRVQAAKQHQIVSNENNGNEEKQMKTNAENIPNVQQKNPMEFSEVTEKLDKVISKITPQIFETIYKIKSRNPAALSEPILEQILMECRKR